MKWLVDNPLTMALLGVPAPPDQPHPARAPRRPARLRQGQAGARPHPGAPSRTTISGASTSPAPTPATAAPTTSRRRTSTSSAWACTSSSATTTASPASWPTTPAPTPITCCSTTRTGWPTTTPWRCARNGGASSRTAPPAPRSWRAPPGRSWTSCPAAAVAALRPLPEVSGPFEATDRVGTYGGLLLAEVL